MLLFMLLPISITSLSIDQESECRTQSDSGMGGIRQQKSFGKQIRN